MQKVRRSLDGGAIVAQGPVVPGSYKDDDKGVTFYKETPDVELSGREFEDLCCDRLKVLHAFDRVFGYDTFLMNIPEMRGKIMPEIINAKLDLVPEGHQQYPSMKAEFCRRDAISHFALRLAFCKTRDAREWIVRQEQRLFVLRFAEMTFAAQEAFMIASGMPCKRFDESRWIEDPNSDRESLTLDKLQKGTQGAKIWNDKQFTLDGIFYEMPFFEVHPSLIAKRSVIIKNGIAFVPSSAMKLIIAGRFKEHLIAGLDSAFQCLPVVLQDPRVGGFLRLLQDHGLQLLVAKTSGSDTPGEKLSLDNFEEFLMRSFPPCMRRVVEAQREMKKHLKHAGRLQLRPFLKDAGFTMDESVKWWRKELTKDSTIDVTSFEKNYTYDLEHAYGKKGNFQGSNCFGCPKIIGFPGEAAGQVHGCPFKLEVPALKQQLHKWRMPEPAVAEIEKLVTNGKHYQLACIEYFKAGHQGHEGDGVGNSPNEFFKASCQHYLKKAEKEGKSPNKAQVEPQAITAPQPQAITAGGS